jgi:Zn-dependent oligopeptidase
MGNYCCRSKKNENQLKDWAKELNEVGGITSADKEETCRKFVTGKAELDEDSKRKLLMFETLVQKLLDVGNLKKYVKHANGKDAFEFAYFAKLMKVVFFWKMLRLHDGFYAQFRTMRRQALFGVTQPPKEKTESV